jgi:hypothetical protein
MRAIGRRAAVNTLFALALVQLTLILLSLLLWSGLSWAGTTRCTTYPEQILGRLDTVCADVTRAITTWNWTLERRDITITDGPRKACSALVTPSPTPLAVHCG